MGSLARICGRIVGSSAFVVVVFLAILANAATLGAETYAGLVARHGGVLDALDSIFLSVFVVEIALRLASYGRRPQDFFRSGWNVFDFVVVGAAFVPGVSQNATLLRIARLARVVRVVRVLPDLRVLLLAVVRSLPPLASMSVLTALILYVYGILGWLLFGAEDPERWGDIGTAMLNLFVMLSLENLPQNLEAGMAIHPWSWVYFVSFALVAAFIVLNVLIGVVINSLDEARAIEARRIEDAAREAARGDEEEIQAFSGLAERVSALRVAAEELERELETVAETAARR